MEIRELTEEQKKAILSAYRAPGRGVKAVAERLKATGVPLVTCTAWLMLTGVISYTDMLKLNQEV